MLKEDLCIYNYSFYVVVRGADISSKNEDGNTSREVAELNEKDDIVKLLEGAMENLKI